MLSLLLFDDETRAALVDATKDRFDQIDPRQIVAGPHAGKWAASPNIASDPAFDDLSELISNGVLTSIDINEAWPPEE